VDLLLVFETLPLEGFVLLLMEGVGVQVEAGCTAAGFIREHAGLTAVEVDERIRTVCVDGSPVDDLASCPLGAGSRIALSGALPGLAGACLRRGGALAGLRRSITMPQTGRRAPAGTVTVRLFNTVIPLLGPRLLARGVLVEGADLIHFVAARPAAFWRSARRAELDGRALGLPLTPDEVAALVGRRVGLVATTTSTRQADDPTRGLAGAGDGQAVRHPA
jgi:hypothetical protein